jgi:hypothetical protein
MDESPNPNENEGLGARLSRFFYPDEKKASWEPSREDG